MNSSQLLMLPNPNLFEILICLSLIFFTSFWFKKESLKLKPWMLLCLGTAFIYSLQQLTQFGTTDEYGISIDLLNPRLAVAQWMCGAFRTSLLIYPLIRKILLFFTTNFNTCFVVFKSIGFLIGFILIISIGQQLFKLYDLRKYKSQFWILYLVLALTLPTNNLALKTFNYDSISLFGSILALLLSFRALKDHSSHLRILSVLFATLAAQEKLSASPILIIVIALTNLIDLKDRKPFWQYITPFAISIGVCFFSNLLYYTYSLNELPPDYWLSIFDPIISWTWVPINFLFKFPNFLEHRFLFLIIGLLMTLGAVYLSTLFIQKTLNFLEKKDNLIIFNKLKLFTVPLFLIGIVGALYIQPFWGPFKPISEQLKANFSMMNGVFLHFGSTSMLTHYLSSFAYTYSMFTIAVPTITWVVIFISTLFNRAVILSPKEMLFQFIILGFIVMLPLVAVLTNVPIGHRYLNISIFLLVIFAFINLIPIINNISIKFTKLAITSFVLFSTFLIICEISPFPPLYAAFRPIWLSYANPTQPILGVLNHSWVGWGEELMLAGKKILSMNKNLATENQCITLHHIYPGFWLQTNPKIQVNHWWKGKPTPLTDKDYYLVNRSAFIQNAIPIPTILPIFTISYRGYDQAWIFRGDQLEASGYKFP